MALARDALADMAGFGRVRRLVRNGPGRRCFGRHGWLWTRPSACQKWHWPEMLWPTWLALDAWWSYDFGAMATLAINVSVIVDGVRRGREQPLFVGGRVGLSSLLPQEHARIVGGERRVVRPGERRNLRGKQNEAMGCGRQSAILLVWTSHCSLVDPKRFGTNQKPGIRPALHPCSFP